LNEKADKSQRFLDFAANSEQQGTFRLLIAYRWLSLLLPLVWLLLTPSVPAGVAFALAVLLTLGLTVGTRTSARLLLDQPWLFAVDIVITALIVWLTATARSPYYFYSLAPILAAALFFQIRGGLTAAAGYGLLFLLACALPQPGGAITDPVLIVGQFLSFFLVGTIFGYPSRLLVRLQQTYQELSRKNSELTNRNRDLNLVRELSLVMQSSIDPTALQESILRGLVRDLDYQRATIGLYDELIDSLTSWLTVVKNSDSSGAHQLAHAEFVSLSGDSGPLARSVKGKLVVEVMDGEPPTNKPVANSRLVTGPHYVVLPLSLRGRAIGVIIVDQLPAQQRLSPGDRASLDSLATHAGVALGSIHLCIDRAQQVAIVEERNRIAADLHDNVSQTLYGLAYGLDASIQMLPAGSEVRPVLVQLHQNVTQAQSLLRQTIFNIRAEDVTSEIFVAGLHRRLRSLCPNCTVSLRIDLPGDFDHWSPELRDTLYQVAREALANAARHAQATHIVVVVDHSDQAEIELRISDDGEGFDPGQVDQSQHLGLQSIEARINSLNGTFNIYSTLSEGTLVTAKVPLQIDQPDYLSLEPERIT
jgi:signal transduction histidine kinase